MPQDTTKKLSKEEFMTYRRSFETNKYHFVDADISNLVSSEGDPNILVTQLDGLDCGEIATLKRVPRHIGEAYEGWMDSDQTKEDNQKLVSDLRKVCSCPELLLVNEELWSDVQKNTRWCDFNEVQQEGYEIGGETDDFTDIGTGSLLNEDAFLDEIAHVCDADEE